MDRFKTRRATLFQPVGVGQRSWPAREYTPQPPPFSDDPLGRYEVLGLLAAGGMGEVWRVRDHDLGRIVLVKVVRSDLGGDEAALEALLAEARLTASLDHPGVVPLLDLGFFADGRAWFSMREVPGRTLTAVLSERQPKPSEVADWVRRAGEAVAYAHHRGVLHLDLKPDNIMLGDFGEVTVLDWGIGQLLREVVGQVAGTPGWMSPEQARGEVPTRATDVFGLGALLWAGLERRVLHEGAGAALLEREARGLPPPRCRGPKDLVALVQACLEPDPKARPAGAKAVVEALRHWSDRSARTERGRELVAEANRARAEATALRPEAKKWAELAEREQDQPHEDPDGTAPDPQWPASQEAARLQADVDHWEIRAAGLLRAALTQDPDLEEAQQALADFHRVQAEQAEARGLDLQARLHRLDVQLHDRGRHARWLAGRGALTLETDPPGAQVEGRRYEERGPQLVLGPPVGLGRTPLRAVDLEAGSWLLELRLPDRPPVNYPILVPRDGHWHWQDGAPGPVSPVALPREHPPGFCYIPAGKAFFGDPKSPTPTRHPHERWVDGYFLARFPVTNREYLVYLNDLVALGRVEEALEACPQVRVPEGEPRQLLYGFDGGRFSLRPDAEGHFWLPEYPVYFVDLRAARAYARWRGAGCRLPTRWEFEKAGRGVDGRDFPWGRLPVSGFSCTVRPGQLRLPAEVQSYPRDTSPYGVRHLAGLARSWVDGSVPGAIPGLGLMSGGAFSQPFRLPALLGLFQSSELARNESTGIRLACPVAP